MLPTCLTICGGADGIDDRGSYAGRCSRRQAVPAPSAARRAAPTPPATRVRRLQRVCSGCIAVPTRELAANILACCARGFEVVTSRLRRATSICPGREGIVAALKRCTQIGRCVYVRRDGE